MHRALVVPFALLAVATAVVVLVPSRGAGLVFLLSDVAALGCVPLISRRNLLIGYAALCVPFLAVAVVAVWSPHTSGRFDPATVDIEVNKGGTIYWETSNHSGLKSKGDRPVLIRGDSRAYFGPPRVQVPSNQQETSPTCPPPAPRH